MCSSGVRGGGSRCPCRHGGTPVNAPFAAGRGTNAKSRRLPSGNGLLGQGGPTDRPGPRFPYGLAGPPKTPPPAPRYPLAPNTHLWYRQAHFLQGTDGTCNFFFFLLLFEGEQQDFLKRLNGGFFGMRQKIFKGILYFWLVVTEE